MNVYLLKGLKRIPLHATAFCGFVGTASFVLWAHGTAHYLLIPGLLGVLAAFGKELIEQVTVGQVWVEFWVDSLAQASGALLGVVCMWFASN